MATTDLLSTAEAAERLGVVPQTIAEWVKEGRITAAVQGAGIRGPRFFTLAEVKRLQRERAAS